MDETRSGKSRDTPFATVRATFCSNRCRRPIRKPHLLNAEFYRFRPTVAANSCTETCLMYCSLKTFTGNVYIYMIYILYILYHNKIWSMRVENSRHFVFMQAAFMYCTKLQRIVPFMYCTKIVQKCWCDPSYVTVWIMFLSFKWLSVWKYKIICNLPE